MNTSTLTRGDLIYAGKANNVFATSDPQILELEASDRISAGNGAKTDTVEGKGAANNSISMAIFKRLEEIGIPTHYIGPGTNECSKFVKKTDPIKLEVIARFYATGSIVKRYDAVYEMAKFDPVLIEYTYKSDEAGDPPISGATVAAIGVLTNREVGYIEYLTDRIAYELRKFFDECNGTLIDFKVEFGRLPNGQIILIDEISPDTCRILDKTTGKSLDKDRFRKDLGQVAEAYIEMAARVENLQAEE